MPCPFIDALAKQPEYHLDDNDDSNLAIRNTEHKGLELEERFGYNQPLPNFQEQALQKLSKSKLTFVENSPKAG